MGYWKREYTEARGGRRLFREEKAGEAPARPTREGPAAQDAGPREPSAPTAPRPPAPRGGPAGGA